MGLEPSAARPSGPARLLVVDLGRLPLADAVPAMADLAARRAAGTVDDVLLTCEHDPVYSAGRHADVDRHVTGRRPEVPVERVDRGGDVTYHGPGQLMAYPVCRLDDPKDAAGFVGALQQAAVDCVARFGVDAVAGEHEPGVWVGAAKLAAVGVRLREQVTTHGLALNVDCDLAAYDGIVACGLPDASACSLASLGVDDATVDRVRPALVGALADRLGRTPVPAEPGEVGLAGRARTRGAGDGSGAGSAVGDAHAPPAAVGGQR